MNHKAEKKRSAWSWLAELASPRAGEYLLSVLAALAGALLALELDAEALRAPFGLFLLWAGGSLLWKTWRGK